MKRRSSKKIFEKVCAAFIAVILIALPAALFIAQFYWEKQ